jgi:hypothetical protein
MRIVFSFTTPSVGVFIAVACLGCRGPQEDIEPKYNVWRRHGEGRVREGDNFYMHLDEYKGYGIISYDGTSTESSENAKRDAIKAVIDRCRKDYGGIAPQDIDPPLHHIVIVVEMHDGMRAGAVFDAHEILLGDRPSSVLAETSELDERPTEVVTRPGRDGRRPTQHYAYPIIDEYERLHAR